MMDVYQTVLANTSQNYNVFWVFLRLSKSRKINMYYLNEKFSGVLQGFQGFTSSHVEEPVSLYYTYETH